MVVYILIGLLIVGLAGFGIGGFSTSVRAVGTVGDEEITVDDYVRALQSQIDLFSRISGTNLSLSEAVELGLDREALEALVLRAAVDNEATRVGISVGDETVLQRLRDTSAFHGVDGTFDQSSYTFALERTGLTPGEYDEIVRDEETRRLVGMALSAGIQPSNSYLDDLIELALGTRNFRWVEIDEAALEEPVPDPTDTDLRNYYDENPDEFTDPLKRMVTVASLTPDMLTNSIEVDEAALREEYEGRIDEYQLPERRFVDRLVFPDDAAAQRARDRLDADEAGFIDLLSDRGITLEDVSLGEVTRPDLTDEAADLLFGSQDTGIYGPVESALGPAIFRVTAVLAAQNTSFEDARAQLEEELKTGMARDMISGNIESYEDLLAGGATLEEIAAETELELSTLAVDSGTRDGLARYVEFRNAVATLQEGDFPELLDLPNGGVFAARLDDTVPPTLRPFDTIEEEAAASWREAAVERLVLERAEFFQGELTKGRSFEELGLEPKVEIELSQGAFVSGAPPGLLEAAFGLDEGEAGTTGSAATVAVILLDAINPVDFSSDDAVSLREAVVDGFKRSSGQDLFRLYSEYLQRTAGISIDHAIIDSIHAQLP